MQLSSCFPFVGNAISRITSIVQSFSLFPKMPILAFVCEVINFFHMFHSSMNIESPTADDDNKLDIPDIYFM